VRPEARQFLDKANLLLKDASTMLSVQLNEQAGRTAYLAGFHAAQALIFETNGRVLKTHHGVQSEFLRITQNEPRLGEELRGFLSRTYNLKAIADYETGSGTQIPHEHARAAIVAARRFIDAIESLIGS
jgi:uncharacterized protein (UPF0332 family)